MVADRASETKKKSYVTKPNMFTGIFTVLQVSKNEVYSWHRVLSSYKKRSFYFSKVVETGKGKTKDGNSNAPPRVVARDISLHISHDIAQKLNCFMCPYRYFSSLGLYHEVHKL